MDVEYDRDADALYVSLNDEPYSYGKDLDLRRRIDYAEDGTPVGVELLYPSLGVDLSDLPRADEIAQALRAHDVRVLA